MRRIIIFLVLSSITALYAQSNSVRLNVVLNHVNHLVVNPSQAVTTLSYNTVEDYRNGVKVVQKEHLTVFSTSAYVLNVKLANQDFAQIGGGNNENISLPNIKVAATSSSANPGLNLTFSPAVALGIANHNLISSTAPSFNTTFDVSYQGPGSNEFLKYAEENKTVVFSNDVLYSLEPK
ncbi:hypothetical protein FAZ15_10310 [Sphingobacterium olei]|uniref:Uncharacterized protein n=1 Tax=Sphingobacterium olei TaxID=2571155 RepID=A0A4U0NZP2_9SPHI|nr:hypothetical protein [Sphingobacterium olei]TJZ60391.1 hypothetical protein FAZ15_10310 [Sphingobacterium olei]